jgi:hypothetical protein
VSCVVRKMGNVRYTKHPHIMTLNQCLPEGTTYRFNRRTILPGINTVYFFQKFDWERDILKQKIHDQVRFNLNSHSKSVTEGINVGFAPAHSEMYWLLV